MNNTVITGIIKILQKQYDPMTNLPLLNIRNYSEGDRGRRGLDETDRRRPFRRSRSSRRSQRLQKLQRSHSETELRRHSESRRRYTKLLSPVIKVMMTCTVNVL